MAFEIITLTPFAQVGGGYDPNVNSTDLLPAPEEFGGGSVSDGSDSSYVELGTWTDNTRPPSQQDEPDLFSVDFSLDTAAHPEPTWAYLSIRAKNVSTGDPVWDGAFTHASFHRTDDPTGYIFDPLLPEALRTGEQTEAAWFDQFYTSLPITPGDPGDDTGWGRLADWPDILDALTTTGLRVGFYIFSRDTAVRVPVLDLYEVRLVVACEPSTILNDVWFASPIRQRQRADGLGLSSASRTSQLRTKQGSLRGGPNGVD